MKRQKSLFLSPPTLPVLPGSRVLRVSTISSCSYFAGYHQSWYIGLSRGCRSGPGMDPGYVRPKMYAFWGEKFRKRLQNYKCKIARALHSAFEESLTSEDSRKLNSVISESACPRLPWLGLSTTLDSICWLTTQKHETFSVPTLPTNVSSSSTY